ncbi:hypothetical protein BJ138DRAFT_870645 [Hygrophoropsis aurantiaca]|uniref:Uncharacterized protein n=1 Tax=Hygrophoropsis aurantiaca TaxID=72124 RepID=A0ACB8AET5_9AGAM|nr:hypothetical protein BJ138DRAFT_870645 [Hygrophoropsis aurantiaca]
MCGRIALGASHAHVRASLHVNEWRDQDAFHPRHNIAPSTTVAVLDSPSSMRSMRWGIGHAINARADALTSTWARLSSHRVLVVAHGYYEWHKRDARPHFLKLPDSHPYPAGDLLLFAALYDPKDGGVVVVTTHAPKDIAWLHDRQPVVIDREEDAAAWLAPGPWSKRLQALLVPREGLTCYPVPPEVGKVSAQSPAFVLPVKMRKGGIEDMFARQSAKVGAAGVQGKAANVNGEEGSNARDVKAAKVKVEQGSKVSEVKVVKVEDGGVDRVKRKARAVKDEDKDVMHEHRDKAVKDEDADMCIKGESENGESEHSRVNTEHEQHHKIHGLHANKGDLHAPIAVDESPQTLGTRDNPWVLDSPTPALGSPTQALDSPTQTLGKRDRDPSDGPPPTHAPTTQAASNSTEPPATLAARPRPSSPSDATQTVADASQAVPDTTQTSPDTSQAIPDTSQAIPDTSQAVPDTSQAVPDTSQPAPDTSQTPADISANTPTDQPRPPAKKARVAGRT